MSCPAWVPYGPSVGRLPSIHTLINGSEMHVTRVAQGKVLPHTANVNKGSNGNASTFQQPAKRADSTTKDIDQTNTSINASRHDRDHAVSKEEIDHTAQTPRESGSDLDLEDNGSTNEDDATLADNLDRKTSADETKDETNLGEDNFCQALAPAACVAQSSDYRKVITQFFGRNKSCTISIPDDIWLLWCRKHYQRFTYRGRNDGTWHLIQLRMVGQQMDKFETSGIVRSWEIAVRMNELKKLVKEDERAAAGSNPVDDGESPCWERFLLPYVGHGKSYSEVRDLLEDIKDEFDTDEFKQRDKKMKVFPSVEFLPTLYTWVSEAKSKAKKLPATDHHKRKGTKASTAAARDTAAQPAQKPVDASVTGADAAPLSAHGKRKATSEMLTNVTDTSSRPSKKSKLSSSTNSNTETTGDTADETRPTRNNRKRKAQTLEDVTNDILEPIYKHAKTSTPPSTPWKRQQVRPSTSASPVSPNPDNFTSSPLPTARKRKATNSNKPTNRFEASSSTDDHVWHAPMIDGDGDSIAELAQMPLKRRILATGFGVQRTITYLSSSPPSATGAANEAPEIAPPDV